MSHELVFYVDENGVETNKARLVLCKDGAWHGFGHIQESISIEDCHRVLGTDAKVEVCEVYFADINTNYDPDSADVTCHDKVKLTKLEDRRGLRWWNGPKMVELGSVGPETGILQNYDFIESLRPWLDNGFGTIESAGLLKGGQVIFAQINCRDIQPAVIRELKDGRQDKILPYIGFSNGHGIMAMSGGRTDIREVCWNTMSAANRQMSENGSAVRKTHRAKFDVKNQAKGDKQNADRMKSIQEFLIAQQKDFIRETEQFKFLNSVNVKPLTTAGKIEDTLKQFAQNALGKKEDVTKATYKPGQLEMDIIHLFTNGKGCEGYSWFDVTCAATELLTHAEGNNMKGDRAGDAEARRHYDLWFGTRNSKLNQVLDVAMVMAQKQV